MLDGDDHQIVYEIEVGRCIIAQIVRGKPSQQIKVGVFKIKYPKTKQVCHRVLLLRDCASEH